MANIRGTNLSAAVVPFTTEDSYATHCAKYGQGGWRTVESYEDLNTIADDRLEQGMAVYVNALEKVYILSNLDLSVNPVVKIWTELETGGSGESIQVETLPVASAENVGKIYEYVGVTTEDYINGYFYQCVAGEPVETSVTFTPHAGVETVITISPEDFQAFVTQWCEGRTFTAAEVTHGNIGYFSSDRYSMTIYTDISGQFAYASFTIAELEEAGFSFSPYLSAQQGVDFTCTIAHTPYYWIQKNVQPRGGDTIQVEVLPEPTAENEGQIVEYIGATQSSSTFEVVNTTTTNPVIVDLNKDAFETLIIENFGEDYLNTIAQAPITLNYNYYEQEEQNVWGLYFGERLVGGLYTSELPILGVTITYTEGHEEVNDTITLQYSAGINVVNGYFYQSDRKPIPSLLSADVTTGSDYYVDSTSLDTYEDYVVNTLHEELQDKTYNFTYKTLGYLPDNSSVNIIDPGRDFVEGTYHMAGWDLEFHLYVDERGSVTNIEITGGLQSVPTYNMPVTSNNLYDLTTGTDLSFTFDYTKPVQFWTLDNSPVNLDNYGIELHYDDVEVVIPAALDIDAETYTQDPATFSCDVNTFISSYESMTGRTPEEDMRIGFKGIYGEGWWEGNYTQRSYTDAELASIWGVTITWTSGGQVQDGDSIVINFKAQRTEYEPAQPQDNDVITAEYTAESFVRTWLPKKVQDDGYKIDKFKVFPEATEENLGLIAQYVGETEKSESDILVHEIQSEDAAVSVDFDKNQFEQAIIQAGGEEALSYYMDFRFEWEPSDRAWKCFRNIEHQGEEQIGELRTSDLESFGMYVTVEPSEDTLYRGIISFSYIPAREGEFHNGYFYQSTKVENEESFNIENIEQLALDYSNPYELSIDTYRDYIESQGQELQSTYYNLHYATERPTSRTSGWYDENTGDEYELSDLGVTLNYATLGEINTSSNTICTQESFADSRFFIAKIDNDAIEQLLDTYRIDYRNLTNSISIVFTCIDGINNKWQYNIGKDSILSTGNPEDFNIDIQQREPQRAWQFTTGDTFTLVYSPAYDQNKSSSDYFVIGNYFQNYFGAYIDSVDIDTFESYIGTLPTTATLYKWECVSNEPSVEWTLNGVSANPSDYGLNLHQNRAPAYNVGDTVTMMYVPNRDDAFAIVYTDLTGTGSVASLDKETFIRKFGSSPQSNYTLNFYCTDAGDYERSKWLNFLESTNLSDWGVNLDQIQDQNAYQVGDRIIVMYFAQPRMEIAQPNDYSRFTLNYTENEQYYEWVQKDVQPSSQGVVDYNELENKPAINGVELNSETTTTDLGLMDLSTDQTANGTKIINELYQQDIQPVAIRSYDGIAVHPYVDCLSYVYENDTEVWLATSEKVNAQSVGYRAYTMEIPCIHKLDRYGYDVGKVYLDPDVNDIINNEGFDTSKFLGGFCSNVVTWTNPNDNKKYLLGLTAPCILSIYSMSEIENGSIYSAVGSYKLFDIRSVSDLWNQFNKALNRIRIQGNNLYAFKEQDDGTSCGLYPVKYDLINQRVEVVGPYEFQGGGLYTYWAPGDYNKEGAHDYNIITKNGVDYLYLYLDISNPFSDIYGNYVNYPTATIYKFPLNQSYESGNLQFLSYQFVNSWYDNPEKAIIRKIIKIDERYLLVYAIGGESGYMYFNLFDTDTDSVVNQIRCKPNNIADDYTIYKELEGVYKVSGFIDNSIYQLTIDTNRQIFIEQDESEFIYLSLYSTLTDSLPETMSRSCTMFMWNDTRIQEMGGFYYFESPIYYSHRQSSSLYGGYNPYSVFLAVSGNLVRYATENYVDSTIASSGFITSEYLYNNGYATQSWCNSYNISYSNLSNFPYINGVQVFGNKTSRDYRIIDDYGISITDTQMFMNDKAIRYDTPFQVATVIQGGGSEYATYDVRYVIPSREENGVYYQVVNFKYTGDNTNYYDVFKVNTLTGERTPLCSDRYPSQFSNAEAIAGTYIADEDTLYFVAKREGSASYRLIANRITNLSSDSARYLRTPVDPVYEGTTSGYPAVINESRYCMETLTGAFIDNCHTIVNPGTSGGTVNPNAVIYLNQAAFNSGETFQLEFTSTLLCYSRNRFPHPAEDFKKIGNNIIRYANEGSNHIGIAFALNNTSDNLFTKQTEISLSALGTRLMTWDDINDRMLFLSTRSGSYQGGEIFVYDGINPISNVPIASLPTTYSGNNINYTHFYTFEDSTQHFVAVANNVYNGTGAIFTSSADGINWTNFTTVIYGDDVSEISDIVYLNNTFYVMKKDGRFYSMSTLGSTATVLPELTNRSNNVQGIASDGVSILAPTREVNSIFKYTPGVSQDWSEDDVSAQSYRSRIYQNTYKASIKYSNGKYYIFFISFNGTGSLVSDYLVSNDCGKSWHTEGFTYQTSYNYYMIKYDAGLTSTGLYGVGLDSQDGIYVLQNLSGNVRIYANNNSILNPSNITSLTSYKVETNYGLATINQNQEAYPLSNIHIDKNNTLLTQNIDELYLGEVGFSHKELTFSDRGVLNNQFYGYLLRGNTDNKVYLAPTFLNPNSNIMIPFTSGIDGASVIKQSYEVPFLYLYMDDAGNFYNESTNSQISTLSHLNSGAYLGGNSYHNINATSTSQYRNAIFKVMPTYGITGLDLANGGSGYQEGDQLMITGEAVSPRGGAGIRIDSVDPDTGEVLSFTLLGSGVYNWDPYDLGAPYVNNNIYAPESSGTGIEFTNIQSAVITGTHDGRFSFGNLVPTYGDFITPVLDSPNNEWKQIHLAITDSDLLELRGDFNEDGGIAKIEYIDAYTSMDSYTDIFKCGFYCLITSGNGTVKAYKSEDFSINSGKTYIELRECSSDLSDATAGTNYSISYLAQYAFVYNEDNFYITAPAFVNFKGKITDLYDTNFMELYTSHPTNGFIVPALSNKNFRHSYTKNSDFKRYYYNFSDVTAYGDNWEDGVHTITSNYGTTSGNKEVSVTFEVAAGRLKQVFSITPELGDHQLSSNEVILVNPLDSDPANNIVLEFNAIDLNNTSFIPSIEKYGVVKRGYQVKNDMDVVSGFTDDDSVPTVYAVKQYVASHGGGGSSVSAVQITLEAANWDSITNEQIIQSITGLSASSIIMVVPAPNSMTDYMSANILCTGQATEELTFTYTGIAPSNDITVNVIIM